MTSHGKMYGGHENGSRKLKRHRTTSLNDIVNGGTFLACVLSRDSDYCCFHILPSVQPTQERDATRQACHSVIGSAGPKHLAERASVIPRRRNKRCIVCSPGSSGRVTGSVSCLRNVREALASVKAPILRIIFHAVSMSYLCEEQQRVLAVR